MRHLVIRRAEIDDAEGIARVCAAGWRDTYCRVKEPERIEAVIAELLIPWNPRVPERVQLRDFLAPQLLPLAPLEPFQQPTDTSGQLHGVEGLGDVVDGAEVEPAGTVLELGPGGKEDDRDLPLLLILEQLLRGLPAVEDRHHHAEQDQIRLLALCQLHAGPPVCGLDHLHAPGLEVRAGEQPDRRLVVDV
jgi:hypothetical protein